MFVCLSVHHIFVRLLLTGRCSFPQNVINLWLISNYFGQLFLCPKTCKIFSLIFKTVVNLNIYVLRPNFLPIDRVSMKKVTYHHARSIICSLCLGISGISLICAWKFCGEIQHYFFTKCKKWP